MKKDTQQLKDMENNIVEASRIVSYNVGYDKGIINGKVEGFDLAKKEALEDVEKVLDELHNKYAGVGRLKVDLITEINKRLKELNG